MYRRRRLIAQSLEHLRGSYPSQYAAEPQGLLCPNWFYLQATLLNHDNPSLTAMPMI